ncbi:MAG: YfcE family phosphodiesterase [Clostridia bacterium]|nr:YfcE family phosphodiesterase [Clostridia bacterium]
MRVIILSDSHGFTGRLSTVLTVAEQGGPIDAIIHLGDGYYDLRDLDVNLPPVYQVAGNCDHFHSDTLDFVTLSNAKLLLTHGHYQHVRDGVDDLFDLARQEKCHAALYGHTHVQKMEWRGGILLLNPGAVNDGKYAVLNINRLGAIDPELLKL